MRNQIKTAGILTVMAVLFLLAGCNKNKITPSSANSFVLSVQPPDQAAGVVVSTSIQVVFASPMDTSSVTANFCLVGGETMYEVMDSLNHSMMDYQDMMAWMRSESFPGHFQWNSKSDSGLFLPDSSLMHQTQYMIYMGREMESMHKDGMMDHGEMMGKDFISHFSTEN